MSEPTKPDSPSPEKPRRPYAKPAMEEIRLVVEESVLAACKQPSTCPGNLQHPAAS
jgi:hypothetical protein